MTPWCSLALAGLLALPASPAPRALPAPVPQDDQAAAPRVLAVQVVGNQRFTASQLITALGQPVGAPLSEDRVEEGIRTLWRDFS
ncbi:MAG: hypothetical protein ACYTF3_14295, partial [Planctomycetota bacterium]